MPPVVSLGADVDVRLLDVALQVAVANVVGDGVALDAKHGGARASVITVGTSCAPERLILIGPCCPPSAATAPGREDTEAQAAQRWSA